MAAFLLFWELVAVARSTRQQSCRPFLVCVFVPAHEPLSTGDAGMRMTLGFVAVAFLAVPAASLAQQAATSATVDFGVLPLMPLGGPETVCLQSGFGGPTDLCAYKLHNLTPEEVTIRKGGEVTFQIHGGGHGFAIYEVSKDTTRSELGQYLCAGEDPREIEDPALAPLQP